MSLLLWALHVTVLVLLPLIGLSTILPMDGLLYPHLATLDPLLLNHKYMVQHVLCASETVLLLLWLF